MLNIQIKGRWEILRQTNLLDMIKFQLKQQNPLKFCVSCLVNFVFEMGKVYPGYQRFFSRVVGIFFGRTPKPRAANKDLTETGNRARKVSGTQGRKSAFELEIR